MNNASFTPPSDTSVLSLTDFAAMPVEARHQVFSFLRTLGKKELLRELFPFIPVVSGASYSAEPNPHLFHGIASYGTVDELSPRLDELAAALPLKNIDLSLFITTALVHGNIPVAKALLQRTSNLYSVSSVSLSSDSVDDTSSPASSKNISLAYPSTLAVARWMPEELHLFTHDFSGFFSSKDPYIRLDFFASLSSDKNKASAEAHADILLPFFEHPDFPSFSSRFLASMPKNIVAKVFLSPFPKVRAIFENAFGWDAFLERIRADEQANLRKSPNHRASEHSSFISKAFESGSPELLHRVCSIFPLRETADWMLDNSSKTIVMRAADVEPYGSTSMLSALLDELDAIDPAYALRHLQAKDWVLNERTNSEKSRKKGDFIAFCLLNERDDLIRYTLERYPSLPIDSAKDLVSYMKTKSSSSVERVISSFERIVFERIQQTSEPTPTPSRRRRI